MVYDQMNVVSLYMQNNKSFFILFTMFTEQIKMESTEILQIEEEDKQENAEVSTPERLQCVDHRLATNVCLNSNCPSYVFLCGDKSCECYNKHKGCIKGSIESINEAIEEKLNWIEPFKKRIDNLIGNAIDQLSLFAERIIQKAEKDLNFIGLTQNERKFIKAVRTKKVDSLTGKDMNEIFLSIDNVNGFNDKMKEIQTKINKEWDCFNSSMRKVFQKVEFLLQKFSGKKNLYYFQSSIIQTEEQRKNMIAFFERQIEVTSLLYKASQNDFETRSFFQKCKNIQNTVVICETQYGKIIGGFCAGKWNYNSQSDAYYTDDTAQSFVFSLTNFDKFLLVKNSYAQNYKPGYGPIFGNSYGFDFFICNQANKSRNSGANINNAYYNRLYTKGSSESWERISGSKDGCSFLVKEWQVWHVKFIDLQK